jgi:hypothetical protein
MTSLENLKDSIKERFDRINVYGIVEAMASRGTLAMRPLNSMSNFNPVSYEGYPLVFFVISGNTSIDRSGRINLPVTMVFVTNDFNDLVLIIQAIDEYDFMPLDLNFGSQEIYNKYFDQTEDKPFQGYAFEFSLNVTSTLKELIQ